MSKKRWTFEDDLHLVRYAKVAGVENVALDLDRTPQAVRSRMVHLDGELTAALQAWDKADYENRRRYYVARRDQKSVDLLDEFHIGSPS